MSADTWSILVVVTVLLAGCVDERPEPAPLEIPGSRRTTLHVTPGPEQAVDLLFVIGNPNCMGEEQMQLSLAFGELLSALRSPHFGGSLPDLHLGIVSSDLGAGPSTLVTCRPGGDGGKLQSAPRLYGACALPAQPYISHAGGKTNVKGAEPEADAVGQVLQAFQCIAPIGTSGCPFMHHLESARRALDPLLKVNPGFARPDARLAVIFVANMDDCSARDPGIFALPTGPDDPLGPLSSFRCYRHGLSCTCSDGRPCPMTVVGPRTSCTPTGSWLQPVQGYLSFFSGLRPAGRVALYALAGPVKVEVGHYGGRHVMQRACQTTIGAADPPVRLAAVVEGMRPHGFFNVGLDTKGKLVPATICDPEYRDTLRFIGRSIVEDLTGRCIPAPLLIPGRPGGPAATAACARGERPAAGGPACDESTLHEAVCTVERVSRLTATQDPSGQAPGTAVARCPRALFDDPTDHRCAGACPCWRIVPSTACRPEVAGSPHGLELLTDGPPDGDTLLRATCLTSTHAWGSAALAP